jgi:hypothetical protein
MTEDVLTRLTAALGYDHHEDLLLALGKSTTSKIATSIPKRFSLSTQTSNPQWADYRDIGIQVARPWALRCRIVTTSPYFRFGFKLLEPDGRTFGDGSIKSNDSSMVVHIGRNNFGRPRLKISSHDVFVTSYMGGNDIEEEDRFLFRASRKLDAIVELSVDVTYCATLSVDGKRYFRYIVPPTICRRVVVCAWGDREHFDVEVIELSLRSIAERESQ